jgi:chaperonin GroES
MTLKPLADRVVIKQIKAEEKTKSGIILKRPPPRRKPEVYEVVVVGPGGQRGRQTRVRWEAQGRRQGHHRQSYSGTTVKVDARSTPSSASPIF